MVRLAAALHDNGLTPDQVLRECYGVDLPREVFVITADGPYRQNLLAFFANQPWQLAIPKSRGGLATKGDPLERIERQLREADGDLLPLVFLVRGGIDTRDDGLVPCYRLTELAEGRSTIFGVHLMGQDRYGDRESSSRWQGGPPAEVTRRGDSLLAVLHQHHVDYLQELVEEDENPDNIGGYDNVSPEELRQVKSMVRKIRNFERQARTVPTT